MDESHKKAREIVYADYMRCFEADKAQSDYPERMRPEARDA